MVDKWAILMKVLRDHGLDSLANDLETELTLAAMLEADKEKLGQKEPVDWGILDEPPQQVKRVMLE